MDGSHCPSVLVVEDDPDLCRLLASALGNAGYDVRVVYTAVAGLAQAREWPPHLVLLDLRLPDLDGLSLIARLAAEPRTASLPVVVMSARADARTRAAAAAAGARAVIAKPFELDEVVALVRQHARTPTARQAPPAASGAWERGIGSGISRLVHADLDAERVCQAVVDGAQELLGLAGATLWLVDGDELVLRVQGGLLQDARRRHTRIPIGEGLIGLAARDRRALTVPDIAADPRILNRQMFAALDLHGFVTVPLLHGGEVLGMLSGTRHERRAFEPADVDLLEALADHAATVLVQARHLQESERRRQTAEALAALATEVSAAESPEAVLDRVVGYVRQLVDAPVAFLDVVRQPDGQGPILKLEGARGSRVGATVPEEGRGLGGWVLRHGRSIRTPDYLSESRISHELDDLAREEEITSGVGVPVRLRGETVGVLGAYRRDRRPFTAEDERVLGQLAAQAAVALGNVWLYREVARGKQQWETTVDHLHEGLALVDREFRILRINRTLSAWTGTGPAALVGRPLAEVVPVYATEAASRRLAEAAAGTTCRTATVEEAPFGRVLEETLAPVADGEGRPVGLVVTLRDVTGARRLSAQLMRAEKLASLGEMLAGVAHELNNPLTGVLGFAQLLETQVDDPGQKEDLRKLAHEAMRAARLVQNLLRFSRQHPPERRATDLNSLVRAASELLDGACRADGITLEPTLAPDLPVSWVDPHQLQQVLVNLLTNARQAMAAARRKGRIRVLTRAAGAFVDLDVIDEGPGIPAAVLPRIFDPFFTTKAPGEGTGLGLSLCHSVVAAHGGDIWAESVPGLGTAMHVRLPVVLPPGGADAPAPVAPAAHADGPVTRPRRVLVAEDEPALRALAREALTPRGHVVETVADGRAALERLDADRYDVLLLDLRMPGMDGRETVERLRREGNKAAPRIVVMTGDSIRPETREWLDRVGLPVLDKPFTLQALVAAVEG
jgi:two-component system, NtrC family, sensor kinase